MLKAGVSWSIFSESDQHLFISLCEPTRDSLHRQRRVPEKFKHREHSHASTQDRHIHEQTPTHNHQSYDRIQTKIFPGTSSQQITVFFPSENLCRQSFWPPWYSQHLHTDKSCRTQSRNPEGTQCIAMPRVAGKGTMPSIVVAGALCLDCVHVVTSSFAFSFLPYLLLFHVV